MKIIDFEGIPLHICDLDEVRQHFTEVLNSKRKEYISFINPEIFLQQEKDRVLHSYFMNSSMNFVDGVNLLYAINKKLNTKYSTMNRLPGTDFFEYLPTNKTINVFLYGAKEENCLLAIKNIETHYPFIKICGHINGYSDMDDEEIVDIINDSNADIVIVCFGCPKQEYWIKNNFEKIQTKVIFGNGGSIDFWSGNIKRAPRFIIKFGFEWLFRLFVSFSLKRLKRQIKLIAFLYKYKKKKYDVCIKYDS